MGKMNPNLEPELNLTQVPGPYLFKSQQISNQRDFRKNSGLLQTKLIAHMIEPLSFNCNQDNYVALGFLQSLGLFKQVKTTHIRPVMLGPFAVFLKRVKTDPKFLDSTWPIPFKSKQLSKWALSQTGCISTWIQTGPRLRPASVKILLTSCQ